jgi:hypothetical protein
VSFRTVLAVAFVAVLVLGGALIWTAWDSISDRVNLADDKQAMCSTLEDDEREALVGVETPTILTNVEGALDPYTCRWATEDFETVVAYVQTVAAPADKWAVEIRNSLLSQTGALDPERLSQIRKAINRPLETAADGCRFARALFKAGGAADGAVRIVSPSADAQGNQMMVAQSCVDGTYSAVMVTAPGLQMDRQLARKTARALRTVEERIA